VPAHCHDVVRAVLAATGTGWVEKWRSPQELAAVIERCLEAATAVSRDALDRAARQFSWEAQEPALFATMRRALLA